MHVPAVEPGGAASFRELPAPTDDEVARVLATVVRRVTRLLVRRGRLTETEGRHLFEEVADDEVLLPAPRPPRDVTMKKEHSLLLFRGMVAA